MTSLVKLLITLSLSAVLSTVAFAEKTHFNLASQQFSKTLKTSNNIMELARYNLPDAYVTTNLLVRDGSYYSYKDSGFFNIELKKSLLKWGASFDITCNCYYTSQTRSIKLVSEGGDAIVVDMSADAVTFNGQNIYNPSRYERLTIAFSKVGSDVQVTINGNIIKTLAMPNFIRLKTINTQLIDDNYGDRLNDLVIGEL